MSGKPTVVLITGVSRCLGSHLAAQLVADPSIARVIGIDSAQPRKADLQRIGRTEFVRADIRNPLIAKVLAQAQVDTVVHMPLVGPLRGVGGQPTKEPSVVGTMQLLAACQKSETVSRVVVRSTTAVYGSSPKDPAVFTEEMHAIGHTATGYAREAVEIEGHVRGFMRRRPDITVTILRFASLIGPSIDVPVGRLLAMPIIPSSLGFDPRLQLLHESDAVEVLRRASVGDHPGVFNVAADGIIPLSQAVRRARRLRLPVPAPAISAVAEIVRNSGIGEVSAEGASFLKFGRAVDTTRLRTRFGYQPRYTTEQALDSYLGARVSKSRLSTNALRIVEGVAARIMAARSGVPALAAATAAPAGQ
ncbi:MAG: NAD-dependent epimerase/dehydratase family protein [Actinomycetota bacterium]|nr:NAD-dependent epimerase/dehydratase family protein [Actinomycetota bacterium]